MKKHIISMSILAIAVSMLAAKDVTISDNIVKYNQMKAEKYLKKLMQERELLLRERDSRERVRDTKSTKPECILHPQNTYLCQ